MKKPILNIKFNCKEPINNLNLEKKLSNLYPYQFKIDGYIIKSFEGFIQSLKTPDNDIKKYLWSLHGFKAWKTGQKLVWWEKQQVYWNGETIDRKSKKYDELITRSYNLLFEQNEDFRNNLKSSLPFKLDHSIGKCGKTKTLLTKSEFLYQLNRLRKKFKSNNFFDLMNLFK